jgi:DNA-directed RNA polymerase specialized sigma24 family protein
MASKKKTSSDRHKQQVRARSAVARGVQLEAFAQPVASVREVRAPAPVPDVCTVQDLRRVSRQVAAAERRLEELRDRRKSILLDLADEGISWTELGGVVGLSRQAVRKWADEF